MDDDTQALFNLAHDHAVAAESDSTLAVVTALKALATEISLLRTTLERAQQ